MRGLGAQLLPGRLVLWPLLLVAGLSFKYVVGCTYDSSEIGVCLHTYLERDFPSIEMVVYPKGGRSNSGTLMLEGPKLESDCQSLKQVLDCFVQVLKRCKYMEDYFSYRRLIDSLEKTHSWMCSDSKGMRERFVVVLTKLQCIEKARMSSPDCSRPNDVKENVWNRVLRLEENDMLCGTLQEQQKCLVMTKWIFEKCGAKAHEIYSNMSSLFLSSWCPAAASHLILTGLPMLLLLLVVRVVLS